MLSGDGSLREWSRMKLDVLGKDLPVYTTILHRQRSNHDGWPSHLHYVDAFAGLGRYPSDADVGPTSKGHRSGRSPAIRHSRRSGSSNGTPGGSRS